MSQVESKVDAKSQQPEPPPKPTTSSREDRSSAV